MYINPQNSAPAKRSKLPVIITIVGILSVIIITVIVLATMSAGRTTTGGTYPAPVSTDSLSCSSTTFKYPFFTDFSDKISTKVNLALGDNQINSISIITTMTYNTPEDAENSRNVNIAALNNSFSTSGIAVDLLSPAYSRKDSIFNSTLYASSKNLDQKTLKYFLLDGTTSSDYNLKSLSSIYGKKGFDCVANT